MFSREQFSLTTTEFELNGIIYFSLVILLGEKFLIFIDVLDALIIKTSIVLHLIIFSCTAVYYIVPISACDLCL